MANALPNTEQRGNAPSAVEAVERLPLTKVTFNGDDGTTMHYLLEEEVAALLAHKDQQLAECYRLTGADPDGDEDWRLAPHAVAEVRRLREESDATESALATEKGLREKAEAALVDWIKGRELPTYDGLGMWSWIERAEAAESTLAVLKDEMDTAGD